MARRERWLGLGSSRVHGQRWHSRVHVPSSSHGDALHVKCSGVQKMRPTANARPYDPKPAAMSRRGRTRFCCGPSASQQCATMVATTEKSATTAMPPKRIEFSSTPHPNDSVRGVAIVSRPDISKPEMKLTSSTNQQPRSTNTSRSTPPPLGDARKPSRESDGVCGAEPLRPVSLSAPGPCKPVCCRLPLLLRLSSARSGTGGRHVSAARPWRRDRSWAGGTMPLML
mmetsp:Transcript_47407/g.131821  ORF Transcript_47407/g.131821 Transcript_47407/m.131821 type:complete len:227 (-) Transcript_47407:890-1570(-)